MPASSTDNSRTREGVPLGLLVAIGWLIFYGFWYFQTPLSTTAASAKQVHRGDLWASLLVADQMVGEWLAGASGSSLAQRAVILGTAAAISVVAVAAGWITLRLSRVDRLLTRLETLIFSAGVGFSLVSTGTLALGLAGWLSRGWFIALGVAIAALAGGAWFRSGGRWQTVESSDAWPLDRRWLWLAAPFVAAITFSSMLPPTDFDVREYHLQAPKEFYQAGRITFLPHNVYVNMPLGAEMLSLVGMVVLDDWWIGALVGKTLIGLFAPLTALALYAAGCRFATRTAGILAALVYISIPWVALVSTAGLIDGVFAFYLFAAAYAAYLWKTQRVETSSTPLLLLSGFLAGGAASTKYPGVVFCAIPVAGYVGWQALRTFGPRRTPAALLVFGLACTAGCGLWFAKNLALTGNPTYPLLYSIFDGATRTDANNAQWQRAHSPPSFQPSDLAQRVMTATLASDWLSPMLVPLAALAFWSRERRLAWLVGGYVLLVFVGWWLFTHRIERFLVPVLPLVALLAGLGATWNASRLWRTSVAVALGFGMLFSFLLIGGGVVAQCEYLADVETWRTDRTHVGDWHVYVNERAPEVSGLLLVGDAQPFDLNVPVIYNTVFDASIFEQLVRDRSPEEVRDSLAKHGISHILVDWDEIARYRSPGNYGIADFLTRDVFDRLVRDGVLQRETSNGKGRDSFLYRVLPKPAEPKPVQ